MVEYGKLDDADLGFTYALRVYFTVIGLMLPTAARNQWEAHQVDFSSAFLQASLEGEVYLSFPKHFWRNGVEQRV